MPKDDLRMCREKFFESFFSFIFGVPHLATYIFLIIYNEPELGADIDSGMALTPLPSSIGWGSNPQPSDCEPSALPLDHSFMNLAIIFVLNCNSRGLKGRTLFIVFV